jgi:hypothetical protein
VAGINSGSRSVIRQFLARNRPADLAAAMRKRYSVTGQFQGVGQRLATFGLVGVGMAAGSQWSGSDVDGGLHFEPFFDTVRDMFCENKVKVDRSLAMLTDFERTLDEFSHLQSAFCIESSFDLRYDSSLSCEASCPDTVDEISMLDDARIELTSHNADVSEVTDVIVQCPSSIVIEESQAQLSSELLSVLTTADTQRRELDELHVIVSQLSLLLSELTDTVTSGEDVFDDFVVIEDESVEDDELDENDMRLWRALSLVSRQKQQLGILHKTVREQNEHLM